MKELFFSKRPLVLLACVFSTLILPVLAWESRDKTDTIVDWKSGEIRKTLELKLPKIVFHPDDPDYNREGTAKNLTEARNIAKEKLREDLKKYLFRGMENLRLDSGRLLREKIAEDESFREVFQEFYGKDPIEIENRFKENRLNATGIIPLKGNKGVFAHILVPYGSENFPEFVSSDLPADSYTGLIVDARHLKAEPALFPEIRNEDGVSLYSPLFLKKGAIVNNGFVMYLSDPKEAMRREFTGDKPYIAMALSTSGKYPVDLVVSTEDGERILASPKTREALRKGKVIILLGKPEK
ncbi:hypothetical protein LEP1GSC047_4360 [Leptospira inadai serovar Lyme str. 10]|uniref:Uncharacterized protein n=2 Tax=Leptospira inadai serovar Lyme TaxID=293084 RepID=V6HBZ2_9LEPT|nr:hypothetical protein [Leptospira inadai]EQA37281.1 hypothetical protein LEP1GSC047_4360 [Leptospira inadai serovar Lyme str. 10]PNV72797.1 hypothetical protein BES34_018695 [Leptospira inadai serovar Lyme]